MGDHAVRKGQAIISVSSSYPELKHGGEGAKTCCFFDFLSQGPAEVKLIMVPENAKQGAIGDHARTPG